MSDLITAIERSEKVINVWDGAGLCGYRGSIAHGTTDSATDDVDLIGIFVAPPRHYLGLNNPTRINKEATVVEFVKEYDFCFHELRKFVTLCVANNPDCLPLLYLPGRQLIVENWWGRILLQNRDKFLSKRVFQTFGGYANNQCKKMLKPCTKEAFQGSKRQERFAEFGYDCKNASHMIRLLRMGREILDTGEMIVERPDAQELIDIKRGLWTLKDVMAMAVAENALLQVAYETSVLPAEPDRKAIEEMLCNILTRVLK